MSHLSAELCWFHTDVKPDRHHHTNTHTNKHSRFAQSSWYSWGYGVVGEEHVCAHLLLVTFLCCNMLCFASGPDKVITIKWTSKGSSQRGLLFGFSLNTSSIKRCQSRRRSRWSDVLHFWSSDLVLTSQQPRRHGLILDSYLQLQLHPRTVIPVQSNCSEIHARKTYTCLHVYALYRYLDRIPLFHRDVLLNHRLPMSYSLLLSFSLLPFPWFCLVF